MTLATHAVTGALIGAVASQNLVAAAAFGFVSHFLFDTIPHWDYKLGGVKDDISDPLNTTMNVQGPQFVKDLAKIGFDFWLGMAIVFLMVAAQPLQIIVGAFIGAFFAVIPDPLQFVYWKLRPHWMTPLQQFHKYMHAKAHLKDQPLIGISSQAVIILLTMVVFRLIYS